MVTTGARVMRFLVLDSAVFSKYSNASFSFVVSIFSPNSSAKISTRISSKKSFLVTISPILNSVEIISVIFKPTLSANSYTRMPSGILIMSFLSALASLCAFCASRLWNPRPFFLRSLETLSKNHGFALWI